MIYGLTPDGNGVWQLGGTAAVWTKIAGNAANLYLKGETLYVAVQDDSLFRYDGGAFTKVRAGSL